MADAKDTRGYGRTLQGVVTSNKMDKTVTVMVERKVPHKYYGKIIRRRDKYHAHDEKNVANEGDTVQIVEAAPTSKSKRWRLQNVLEKARI